MTDDYTFSPSTILVLLTVWGVLATVSYIGYFFGKKMSKPGRLESPNKIDSNILALLALALSFSLSLAISRYEGRKKLLVDEANAISTASLRSEMVNLPESPHALFLQYLKVRMDAYLTRDAQKHIFSIRQIERKIWNNLKQIPLDQRSVVVTSYMESLNLMFDTSVSRENIFFRMLPFSFYLIIMIIAAIGLAAVNFDFGYRSRSHWKSTLYIMLIGCVLSFIYDIDHPRQGLVQIDQKPLIQLYEQMRHNN